MLTITACTSNNTEPSNPLLTDYNTSFNIPPFDEIEYSHYLPAVRQAIEEHNAEIEAIVNNTDEPTWQNTILALDNSDQRLTLVANLIYALSSSDNTPEMMAISEEALPLLSQHADQVGMNAALFDRIRTLYDRRSELNLDTAQMRLLESNYKSFVHSGALLSDDDKATLMNINTQLTLACLNFSNTLLTASKESVIVVDTRDELCGLDSATITAAASEALERGMEGKYVLTLDASVRLNVLTNCDNREVRQHMYQTYTSLCSEGQHSNSANIDTILHLRQRKAQLLGFDNYAQLKCDLVMAKTPEAARELLMQLWQPAVNKVRQEVADMTQLASQSAEWGSHAVFEPWDYYYYAEKLKAERYHLTEDDTKPYFELNNVVNRGIFNLAHRLYGITITELNDVPRYNPDVTVYQLTDADGQHVAIFMFDPYARQTKVQGAWMSEFQGACNYVAHDQHIAQRPIVFNVLNLQRPADGEPCLLSIDEVETIFHEFGHALQGMLTTASYRGQAGTNVDRDCVELPSQINEKWAFEPELLREYALHHATGQSMPDELIDKILASRKHNQGFMTCELVGAALLDLEWHTAQLTDTAVDVAQFEREVAERLGLPREVQFRYRSPYFKHIFGDDGYAAGYYTYLWADVLVSDGYDLFRQRGAFDAATAHSYLVNILQPGDAVDPMDAFVRFRGHQPSVDALLRDRGLN